MNKMKNLLYQKKYRAKLFVSMFIYLIVPMFFESGLLIAKEINSEEPPNVIIIMADDLGYGDLSVQGHPLIRTPSIDKLAAEGQRWTSFYACSNVCAPSRTGLITGRLSYRVHEGGNPWSALPSKEYTLAELLGDEGYSTAIIGKWHLGMEMGSHPLDQGFDYFYGLAGSNDKINKEANMERTLENIRNADFDDFDISLIQQREVIENPVQQDLLTKRYTNEAVNWIREHKSEPFFLYLAHSMPHVPIYASPEFIGQSETGLYGDVIEEIDWSVGEIKRTLEEEEIDKKTLVIFTSDNGPWLTYYDLGGSPGHLRDGKFTVWEGGFRIPGIFWWQGIIEPSVVTDIASNIDLFATIASIVGKELPSDRIYDSYDLSPTLLEGKPGSRKHFFYYGERPFEIWAVRSGKYKMILKSRNSIGTETVGWRGYSEVKEHDIPLLYDLNNDLNERHNLCDSLPDTIIKIQNLLRKYQKNMSGEGFGDR